MPGLLRLLFGIPLAALVTFALFSLMRALIFTDAVELPERPDDLRVDIRPQPEELGRQRTIDIRDVDRVNPPPPPPPVDRQRATQPTEGLATISGAIPQFEAPQLSNQNVSFNVSDRDAQPMVRIPPQYPLRAQERGLEGVCTMNFDVSPDGTPIRIRATCTNSVFESASIRAVERWRYAPRIVDGVPVGRVGVVTNIDFTMPD